MQNNQHADPKILEQIKSLLNMTEERGCTPGEVEAAASAVQRLLLKHNLDLNEIRLDHSRDSAEFECGHTVEELGVPLRRPDDWAYGIAEQVAGLCFCRSMRYAADRKKANSPKRICWIGSPTDTAVARELFKFFMDQAKIRCRMTYGSRPDKAVPLLAWEIGFYDGFGATIITRIQAALKEREGMGADVTAIVVYKEGEQDAYMKKNFKLTTVWSSRLNTNPDAWNRGAEQGRTVPLERMANLTGAK